MHYGGMVWHGMHYVVPGSFQSSAEQTDHLSYLTDVAQQAPRNSNSKRAGRSVTCLLVQPLERFQKSGMLHDSFGLKGKHSLKLERTSEDDGKTSDELRHARSGLDLLCRTQCGSVEGKPGVKWPFAQRLSNEAKRRQGMGV
ncbi:hypothetical protein TWF730_006230 [Orbilia blumenaviensis]|uniref:Uncharacterized protein n=1 Tax=Orbilia blumenaviensis TaxID=1796055 RepID=A0AAV9VDL5_9PEZI